MKKVEARIAEVADIVYEEEHKIDDNDKVYLMTWAPDPKFLPDCDFINQHIFLVPYVKSYLEFCKNGLACVESTQLGNPHYHLWYQTRDDPLEMGRIRWIKVLSRIGLVKINSKVRYYRKNSWSAHRNALHYYKADSINQQLNTPYNPVSKTSAMPDIDYSDYSWFFASGKKTSGAIREKVSQIKDLEEFYKKSI